MRAPMMSIHTVAAGGGSILALRRRALSRRARRARAPTRGRRATGAAGRSTVTDANVMLGKIQPAFFPRVFGPRGDEALDARRRRGAGSPRSPREIERATGTAHAPEAVAEGFVDIAVGSMANAIKKISVARGYDVTRYTLQCFGGAGGQHACLVADALGMSRVFVHPLAGVLSAYGMGLADQSVMREAAIEQPLGRRARRRRRRARPRSPTQADGELARQGVARERDRACTGASTCATRAPTRRSSSPFGDAARAAGGVRGRVPAALRLPDAASARLIVEAVSVEAVGAGDAPAEARHELAGRRRRRRSRRRVRLFSDGRWHDAALVVREQARPGHVDRRPGDHRREQRDHRRRARLAGARHRARPPACSSACSRAQARRADRHARSTR